MIILETERLLLRLPAAGDAIPIAELWSSPDVMRYMGGPRDFDRIVELVEEEVRAGEPARFTLWPVVERESGRIVGECGLLEKEVDGEKEIELCYLIAASAWGRGYATEIASALRDRAAHHMSIPRLIALIDPENIPSENVAKKIGMRLERETVRPSGKRMLVYVWKSNYANINEP